MIRIIFTFFTLILVWPVFSQQPIALLLEKRGEVVVSIDPTYIGQIPNNHAWSIEPMPNGQARVYLNKKQYQTLLNLEIPFIPQAIPSMESEATMANAPKEMNDWNAYPDYETYLTMMEQFVTDFPELCQLDTIGYTKNNRLLLALKISDNVALDEPEPEVFYTSSMHGDELTGYVLMLRLADYLLNNYNTERIKSLVNNLEIYINPLANPDGTFIGGNSSVNGAIRYNANYVDINRNFPDPKQGNHPDGEVWQPETLAMIDFMGKRHFNLSMNFHGGAELLNYPWDTFSQRHVDNDWFVLLSREYADTVHVIDPFYLDDYEDGITNGYDWYEVAGGRQDYITYFLHGREITAEISSTKLPSASLLPGFWDKNYRSLLNYLNQALYGVHGFVTDTAGNPLQAKISISRHDADSSLVYSQPNGYYVRYLKEGAYELTFEVDSFVTQTVTASVKDFETLNLDVIMQTPVAVVENQLAEVKIYPNPADAYFELEIASSAKVNVTIYNSLGKRVLFISDVASQQKIDVSDLKTGVYFVEFIQAGQSILIQRIVVE
jgi:hypothetical protein